ncbi:SDR family NAD(P)-dependent oxidoreductase [Pseudomaricurvus alkylphenolicus]|uniref:oxidoreductase n=1 Tax=Pseudomaricurvus alkylphenolicus TaxID=1306991 RepID=UPI001421DE0A|nr:oxidoreductase [Pseudomaricurvus alkylphenolicus]NIB41512.1 SDR family NAD(P)-dependent oxidoreductase [Pseudomaricurvus alkylphenolicus]
MSQRTQRKMNSGFGAQSHASEVMEGVDLSGKVAVVTGGYSGIGLETTRALVEAGARVYVPARSMASARDNLADLQGVILESMDLADLASVRGFAEKVLSRESRLDLLINNAGVMTCPEARVGNGWESQFAINHLGHFVLTTTLLPILLAAQKSRVIVLSSSAHHMSDIRWHDIHFDHDDYEKWSAYGQSKTANALFALALDMKFGDQGLRAFSVHPGIIRTPLQRHLPHEELRAMGWEDESGGVSELMQAVYKSPSQGCATTLWAATSTQLNDIGGLYCEDCDVANLVLDNPSPIGDVSPHAVNEQGAERLWQLTEAMLAEA